MGWWQISGPGGGIDFEKAVGQGGLVNAIPGRSSRRKMYNGDGPADEFGAALPAIAAALREDLSRKATCDDARACLEAYIAAHCPCVKAAGRALDGPRSREEMSKAVEAVAIEYRRGWEREPYPEELRAALSFVLGPHEDGAGVIFSQDPAICPGCGASNGADEHRCHECGGCLS